ncbi:tyrosine-type recombinase/integrase [Candidatus Bipolaricaulota bacterium]|nr:tyrosine-type recombinase/integrase [Candidatus Bipolaricaulota bacterium]
MKSRNQAHIFAAEESYFQSLKTESSRNQSSTDGEELTLSQAIDDFKIRGKVEGRADKTLQQYDYVLSRFSEQFSGGREINSIETRDIRQYLAYLMDDGLANTSVAIHYRVLRAFFNWLVSEGYIARSPVDDIKEPKTPDKFPKTLDEEQIEKLLNTARNWRRTWAGYRNFTMIVTFLDTGLRLNEILNANLENLDLEQRSIKVHGKGAKDRKVYFGKNNYKCLNHWLKMRDEAENILDETIFISQNGDKLKRRHV